MANLEQPGEPVNSRLADNLLDLLATLFSERARVRTADPAALRRSLLLSVHSWIDAYFSKIFKASYGEPPGAYRAKYASTSETATGLIPVAHRVAGVRSFQ